MIRFVVIVSLFVAVRLHAAIELAGEPVVLDANSQVRFTPKQVAGTAAATRAGLVKWAATEQGRELIAHFSREEYRVIVTEDVYEPGVGRAPNPSIATFVAATDRSKVKVYELILNPTPRELPKGWKPLPDQPASTIDQMAAAWAAEMLHIWFYAQGVPLPHHDRGEFRRKWSAVAVQLGFPALTHGEEERMATRAVPFAF